MTFTGVVVALQAIVITYAAGKALCILSKKIAIHHATSRNIIGGVLLVMGIYLLVNIALIKVLPMSELSGATLPRPMPRASLPARLSRICQ